MLRSIMILGVLALAAFMAGWFTVHRDENETTIRFNREEIRSDTSKAIAKGKQLLDNRNASNEPVGDGRFDSRANNDLGVYAPLGSPNDNQTNGESFGQAPQSASRPTPPWQRSRQ